MLCSVTGDLLCVMVKACGHVGFDFRLFHFQIKVLFVSEANLRASFHDTVSC